MSVYSGFATRQQQKRYNDYIQSIIMIMSKRLVKFYAGEECDESKFKHLVLTINDKMFTMEQSKYMQPHYSHLIREMLSDIQKVYQTFNTLKQPDQFSQSFLDLQQPLRKIKFNSSSKLQQQGQESFQKPFVSNDSQKTLHGSKSKLKVRVRTVSPEQAFKSNFYTPDKMNHGNHLIERQLLTNDRDDIFKRQIKKRMAISNFKVPRIEKAVKAQQQVILGGLKGPLSPREFLRTTIMGNQNGNTFQALRLKQKHKKIINC